MVDPVVVCAALLHDTIGDASTKTEELRAAFGEEVASVVGEVTDDKTLTKEDRKRLQIQHAPMLSQRAKLLKLADKICNIRDIAAAPPAGWAAQRKVEYYDWAKRVVDGLRGANPVLEAVFDACYAQWEAVERALTVREAPSKDALENLGRKPLSQYFFMRDSLYSESASLAGMVNYPDDPKRAIANGRRLCALLSHAAGLLQSRCSASRATLS